MVSRWHKYRKINLHVKVLFRTVNLYSATGLHCALLAGISQRQMSLKHFCILQIESNHYCWELILFLSQAFLMRLLREQPLFWMLWGITSMLSGCTTRIYPLRTSYTRCFMTSVLPWVVVICVVCCTIYDASPAVLAE